VTKLGFTYKTVGQQYLGYWIDLFETYKKQYNFEKSKARYELKEEEKISSLDVL